MDRQEVFNTVYTGLAGQGFKQSLDYNRNCMYRGDEGRRCAAGWLITDEEYNPEMENLRIHKPLFKNVHDRLDANGDDLNFLFKLQNAHDIGYTPEDMQHRLKAFANEFSLTIPAIKGV